jgi:hypothetical protein
MIGMFVVSAVCPIAGCYSLALLTRKLSRSRKSELLRIAAVIQISFTSVAAIMWVPGFLLGWYPSPLAVLAMGASLSVGLCCLAAWFIFSRLFPKKAQTA